PPTTRASPRSTPHLQPESPDSSAACRSMPNSLALPRARCGSSFMASRPTLVAILIALLAPAVSRADPSGGLETSVENARAMLIREDLGAGVYLFRAPDTLDYWTSTNSVVIINESDVTVFDSCTRSVTAQAVIAEIRKLTPKPVRTLINSHWHQDHWSGNADYARAFPGIRIVATEATRDYMARMGSAFFAREMNVFTGKPK